MQVRTSASFLAKYRVPTPGTAPVSYTHLDVYKRQVMAKDCPLGPSRTPVGNGYLLMSGTSMATPMVTGAALLLLEKEHRLTPFAVKRRLMLSSLPRQGLLSVDRVLE